MKLNNIPRKLLLILSMTLCSSITQAEEISTVISNGLGRDVNAATQNAAENALIQVVGSFIDAEKSVERIAEIRGAVKEETKQINSRVSEYSQGTIQSIDVLETSQEDGIFRVTARVAVRTEAFQNYIRQSALGQTSINTGLFAKVKAEREQGEDLGDIVVNRVLKDVYDLNVFVVELGEVDVVKNTYVLNQASKFITVDKGETLVSIPVRVSLDPNFVQNMSDTFSKTAERSFKGGMIKTIDQTGFIDSQQARFWVLLANKVEVRPLQIGKGNARASAIFDNRDLYRVLSGGGVLDDAYQSADTTTIYAFPSSKTLSMCEAVNQAGLKHYTTPTPAVSLKVLDSNQVEIIDDLMVDGSQFPGSTVKSERSFILGGGAPLEGTAPLNLNSYGEQALTLFKYGENSNSHDCVVSIDIETEFTIITKMSDDELSRANSIKVSLVR
jgi:gamma-glutamylcyclotransferase (GGCT)/AIG2-like uncharacterized protein YtfP